MFFHKKGQDPTPEAEIWSTKKIRTCRSRLCTPEAPETPKMKKLYENGPEHELKYSIFGIFVLLLRIKQVRRYSSKYIVWYGIGIV